MYGFCSNNALYKSFICNLYFSFNTWYCYYFESNLSLVLHKKVLLIAKKACNIVLQSSKHEEITYLYEFIFVFTSYIIGAILLEKCCRKWGVRKKCFKVGGCPHKGIVYRTGSSNLLHTIRLFWIIFNEVKPPLDQPNSPLISLAKSRWDWERLATPKH